MAEDEGPAIGQGDGGTGGRMAAAWTRDRRERFLAELANSCNVRRAHDAAGMPQTSAYRLRRTDAAFAALWRDALSLGYERLEAALLHQTLVGVNAIDLDTVLAASDAAPAAPPPGDVDVRSVSDGPARPEMIRLGLTLLERAERMLAGRTVHPGTSSVEDTDAALRRELDKLARLRARAAS